MKSILSFLILFFTTSLLAADNPIGCSGANCKVIVETRNGSSTKITAVSAAGTGVVTGGPSGSTAANLVVNGKIANSLGGSAKSTYTLGVANSGTVTLATNGGTILIGYLVVLVQNNGNALVRRVTTYSVGARSNATTPVAIASIDGPTAGYSFSVATDASNNIVVTNSGGATADVFMSFYGMEI